LQVTTGWSQDLLTQVDTNRIDAALLYMAADVAIPTTLNAEPISRSRMLIVAPRTLALRKRPLLADLAAHPWIVSQDGCGYRRALRQALARAHVPFVVAVETLNSELRLALVARGLGLGLTTETALEKSRYRAALDVLDVRDFKADVRFWLIHRESSGRLGKPLALLGAAMQTNPNRLARISSRPKRAP
jgi:DNA-binding transcriptional LysR family regulator